MKLLQLRWRALMEKHAVVIRPDQHQIPSQGKECLSELLWLLELWLKTHWFSKKKKSAVWWAAEETLKQNFPHCRAKGWSWFSMTQKWKSRPSTVHLVNKIIENRDKSLFLKTENVDLWITGSSCRVTWWDLLILTLFIKCSIVSVTFVFMFQTTLVSCGSRTTD